MSYLIDTSILIRSIDDNSPNQKLSLDALDNLKTKNEILCILPQNIIEFWAVATRPTDSNGLGFSTKEAETEVSDLKKFFIVMQEHSGIFENWEQLVVDYKVKGKTSHDARLVAAMKTYGISHLLTFNVKDFKRYEEIITVASPQDLVGKAKK